MKKKSDGALEIICVGLDFVSIESIKKSLKENRVEYHFSYIQDVGDLISFGRREVDAVFFQSNRQSQKTIDDIRKIRNTLPGAAITLLTPRPDIFGMVGAFRAGVFDFLSLPIDFNEIRTVIYRLKLHRTISTGQWNPERAVLHLFSRPESFSSIKDISGALSEYLKIFFDQEKKERFRPDPENFEGLRSKLRISQEEQERIKKFYDDETGLVFGLRFWKNKFHFLVRDGAGGVNYLVVRNKSSYPIREILSDYLANVLKTSVSILVESKRREEMRLLSLTDEVTGLFNQRKLLEDLELYISRYQHDRYCFSLLFVDIDYFKTVNDQFGHVVGSQILIDMAKIVKAQLRSTDLVYRYGGDEFIVLLPRTNVDEAKRIALRISEAVKASEFDINNDQKYKLSLSVGIAEYPTDADTAKSIVDFADKMMYLSKKSGRGKVFHVSEVIG